MRNGNRKTILLVEDEVVIAMGEAGTIGSFGYDVVIATSGEKAIEIATGPVTPDLILMDIDLGKGMTGPEAATCILEKMSIPVVFLTSHAERDMVEKVRGITRYGYVIKNSGDFVLQSSIEMALELFSAHEQIHIDTSERKQLERDYETVIESAIDGFWINDADGRLLAVNEVYCTMSGYSRRDLLSMTIDELEAVEDREATRQHLLRVKAVGMDRFETRHRRSDGTIFDVEVSSTHRDGWDGRFVVFLRDISQRKQTEAALSQSETQFRTIFDQSPIGSVVVGPDKRFVKCNAAFCTFLGYAQEDLIGRSIAEVTHPEDVPLGGQEMKDIVEGKLDSYTIQKRYLRRDGRIVWGEVSIRLVRDEAGKPSYFLPTILDVTDRKKAEEKVQQLLQEKELMLREVHHRIKNNMNTMMCLLSLQAKGMQDTGSVAALNDARRRMQSMMVLYDKLYRSQGFRELSAREYLPALAREIIRNLPNREIVTIETHVDDFILDATVLSQLGIIVNELISNMMKHAFTGRDRGLINLSATQDGGRVMVVLQDDGIGLPEGWDLKHSTGFGLRLVDMLAEQMNGSIRFESAGGTRFVLEFEI